MNSTKDILNLDLFQKGILCHKNVSFKVSIDSSSVIHNQNDY
jgi:hypothetical protein